jgi:hypothetical protein
MLGFRYREDLHGGFHFLSNPVDERAADVALDVFVPDVSTVGLSRTAMLGGPVKLEGFADDPRSDGKLVLDLEQKRALYEISFTAGGATSDGHELPTARYRLRGYKQLEVLNLVDSFTMIRASLYDPTAREIGRAVLRFDVRGHWGSLLRSFRLAF